MTAPPAPTGARSASRPTHYATHYAAHAGATVHGGMVAVPMSEQAAEKWNAWRRRTDVVRSCTGRLATVAGTATALSVLAAPGLWWMAGAAAAAVTAAGAGVLRLQMPFQGHQKATATALFMMPGAALTGLIIAERITASWTGWGLLLQLAAVAAWTAWTWVLRPGRTARRMVSPAPPPAADVVASPVLDLTAHPAARWWAQHVATAPAAPTGAGADGETKRKAVASGTVLEGIELIGEHAMTAIIRATVPGEPVPDISVRRLSALLDVPEDQISIDPVPGRGAGVRRLTIGGADVAAATGDPTTVWAERIAPLAMPGAVLTGVRVGRPTAPPAADAPPAALPDLDAAPTGPDVPLGTPLPFDHDDAPEREHDTDHGTDGEGEDM
ncbi:hypothetical protein [Actinomadura nitritigenes]|uniref:hypothetical protein n=1 Tax=Actinomadura nitritigenes TaxID=134602 RepID=UPI003D9119B4